MRVLFAAPGAYGHIHPMVPLAWALRRHGHDVRWVTSQGLCERVRAMGFSAVPAGMEADQRQAEYRRRFPGEAELPVLERRALMFPKLFGAIAAPAMLPGLLRAAEAFVPDVVIHDAAEFASAVVAGRLGVPHLTHSFGALVPRDFVYSAGEEVAPLWESAGLSPRSFGGSYDHLYVDIYPRVLQPASVDYVPRVQPLRPVAVDAAPGEELPAHLRDLPRPLVYVTFGTVFNAAAVFAPVVEAARQLDATVVVTVGPDGDPAALGVVPPNVIVERYVAQSLLFDRCDVVVSHAGSGTFLSALARAIPQLCLPQAADQFVNASACERIGAGITLEPATVTPQHITDAIERLRTDERFRTGARAGAEAIHAMPPPDEVANFIEYLVEDNS